MKYNFVAIFRYMYTYLKSRSKNSKLKRIEKRLTCSHVLVIKRIIRFFMDIYMYEYIYIYIYTSFFETTEINHQKMEIGVLEQSMFTFSIIV